MMHLKLILFQLKSSSLHCIANASFGTWPIDSNIKCCCEWKKRENFSLLITFSIEFIDTIRFIKAFEIRFMATKYPFHLVPNLSLICLLWKII